MEHFDVYVAGFEVSEDRAIRGLVQVFGMSDAAARIFVSSLPRMGKRQLTPDAADRYLRALRTIGAIVQCSPSTPSSIPADRRGPSSSLGPLLHSSSSLSPPASSLWPPSASLQVLTARATASVTTTSAEDDAMPTIPRAPRVPAGMSALPLRDSRAPLPDWFVSDPSELNRAVTASIPAPVSSKPPHDHDRHYGMSLPVSGATGSPALDASVPRGSADHWAPRADHVGRVDSFAPARAGSVSVQPRAATSQHASPRTGRVVLGLALVAITLLAGGWVAYQQGHFETEATRNEIALRNEGIDPGRHEDAQRFVDSSDGRFEGLPDAQLRRLLEALTRSGARNVWAIGIEARGSSRAARSLVVELPSEAAARRTILFQHVRGAGRHPPDDRGQRFLRLDF